VQKRVLLAVGGIMVLLPPWYWHGQTPSPLSSPEGGWCLYSPAHFMTKPPHSRLTPAEHRILLASVSGVISIGESIESLGGEWPSTRFVRYSPLFYKPYMLRVSLLTQETGPTPFHGIYWPRLLLQAVLMALVVLLQKLTRDWWVPHPQAAKAELLPSVTPDDKREASSPSEGPLVPASERGMRGAIRLVKNRPLIGAGLILMFGIAYLGHHLEAKAWKEEQTRWATQYAHSLGDKLKSAGMRMEGDEVVYTPENEKARNDLKEEVAAMKAEVWDILEAERGGERMRSLRGRVVLFGGLAAVGVGAFLLVTGPRGQRSGAGFTRT
jgi:hypothetical protein